MVETDFTGAMAAVRVSGGLAASFRGSQGTTTLGNLHERGGYRLAFPSTFAAHVEAAAINTGGGVAGGDHVGMAVAVEGGADVVFSSQAAERIYRSDGEAAELDVTLSLAPGARLDWLPQQTMLYAGARLKRRITVDVAASSRLLMVEVLTFGRPASREGVEPAAIDDQWRISRDGRLLFAEAFRLRGALAANLDRPAIGGGARSSALVVFLAPGAADYLDPARLALAGATCESGVSAWNGMLSARLLGKRPADVIAGVSRLARVLAGRDMPRVWSI